MKIAIFFEKDRLSHFNDKNSKILIFDVENEKVKGVETIEPSAELCKDRLSCLEKKGVTQVYLSIIDDTLQEDLLRFDIRAKTASMLQNDKLFNSLYISACIL